jgi:hypothetical protein
MAAKGERRRLSAPVLTMGITAVALAGAAAAVIPQIASSASKSTDVPELTPVSANRYTGGRPGGSDAYGSLGDLFVLTDTNRLQRYDKWGAGKRRLDVAITGLA